MKGDFYTLNLIDQELAVELAWRRSSRNRYFGSRDRLSEEMGAEWAKGSEVRGVGAELAFCRMFDLPDDIVRSDERLDYDAKLPEGWTVDVKSTQPRAWHDELLICPLDKASHPPHIFALMLATHPVYQFMGAMSAKDLVQECMIRNLGYGPCYCASRHHLKDLDPKRVSK